MRKQKIETGKIVGTHGVRGGLRVQPWCDSPPFFTKLKTLYCKEAADYRPMKVISSRAHGNIVILELEGITTIEQAESLRGKVLYLDRSDLHLEPDQYLICDIIGLPVYDADRKDLLGKLSDVSKTGANDVWHIQKGEKEYLIPVIDEVVVSVDTREEKILIRPLAGIFEE